MKKFGFTLIELLVVVAIIGILISLLLPSLVRARDSVKTAVCLSNQKQIGIGLVSFSTNNNGEIPRSGSSWANEIGGQSYLSTPTGSIEQQTRGNVLFCPEGLADRVTLHQAANAWNFISRDEARRPWISNNGKYSWYGVVGSSQPYINNGWRMNTWQFTGGGTTFPKISLFVNLSSTLAIHDGASAQNTEGGNGGRISARHFNSKRTNSLFYDGHAKTYTKEVLFASRTNSGAGDAEIIWKGSRAD